MEYLGMDVYFGAGSYDPVFPGVNIDEGITMDATDALTKAVLEAELRRSTSSSPAPVNLPHVHAHHTRTLSTPEDLLFSSHWIAGNTNNTNTNQSMMSGANSIQAAAMSNASSSSDFNASGFMTSESNAGSPAPETPSQSGSGKKRRQPWGRQLTPPTTNLPPRKRAKTEAEKQQRAYERVIRNRKAAETSRQRKQAQQDRLVQDLHDVRDENTILKQRLRLIQKQCSAYAARIHHLESELHGISDTSASQGLPAPFQPVEPVAPIKISTAHATGSADHFISPSALTCESPEEHADEMFTPSISLVGSPATIPEDESPRTPTDSRNSSIPRMYATYAASALESVLLPPSAETQKPTTNDDNGNFEDVFKALNYERSMESSQLEDFMQSMF